MADWSDFWAETDHLDIIKLLMKKKLPDRLDLVFLVKQENFVSSRKFMPRLCFWLLIITTMALLTITDYSLKMLLERVIKKLSLWQLNMTRPHSILYKPESRL